MGYPEILINKSEDVINPNGYFKLTFEQFYDLMHHSHKLEDIEGGGSGGTIEEITEEINTLKEENNLLKEQVNNLTTQLEAISAIVNAPDLTDYDVEKEGVQDIEGNTIDPETGEIIIPVNPENP